MSNLLESQPDPARSPRDSGERSSLNLVVSSIEFGEIST